nr:2-hydroxyacyl-CoA dehydratase family protein [Candidatus Sigynarchaeota archaeon]
MESKPLLACFPLYPPLELFHSMGFTPVVLWGVDQRGRSMGKGDKHVQNFACLVGRSIVNALLDEAAIEYAGLFYYNACDTLRNLPEIVEAGLRAKGRSIFSTRIHVPASYLHDPF